MADNNDKSAQEGRDFLDKSARQNHGPNQATKLILLADGLDLFNDGEQGYVHLSISGHRETHSLRSRGFRDYLSRQFYVTHKGAPSAQAMEEALRVLDGKARFDGDQRKTYLRVAEHDGAIYLDLADDKWRVVEITADGWRILNESPVHFIRKAGMLAIPEPQIGGSLEELRRFVNVRDDNDFTLVCAYCIGSLSPNGPYVILIVEGEAGSAKSTTTRVIRSMIDPHVVPLRLAPKDESDIIIAASNGWMVALDNLSGLSDHLSDALCVVATGGGLGKRRLYSDSDETLLNVMRPILLNGIDQIARRTDIADRGIVLDLPVIPDEKKFSEAQFWRDFQKARPRILGAMLNAVSEALKNRSHTVLEKSPRMADFAHWVVAAEPALPWESGTFLKAYNSNRQIVASSTLEDPIVGAIQMLCQQGTWTGTASELLELLTTKVPESVRKDKHWPKAANILSGKLRRLATACRKMGIEISFSDGHHPRTITIERVGIPSSLSSQPSQPSQQAKAAKQNSRPLKFSGNGDDRDGLDDLSSTHSTPPEPEDGDPGCFAQWTAYTQTTATGLENNV